MNDKACDRRVFPPTVWKFVDNAINNVKRSLFGGRSVGSTGDHNYGSLDPAQIGPLLRERYHKDFIANWRTYLANSQIARYRSLSDASQKLAQLSSNQSYLLALFCLASVNISAGSDDATAPYQPVTFVTPPTCMDRYVQPNNNGYVTALTNLQSSIDRVVKAGGPPKDDLVTQTMNDADAAIRVTNGIPHRLSGSTRKATSTRLVKQLMRWIRSRRRRD